MKTIITAERLKEITDLAEGVPQEYRAKCFELLLSRALQISPIPVAANPPNAAPPQTGAPVVVKAFLLPIDVRAFLSQYTIEEAKLWKLFLVVDTDVRPTYSLSVTKRARAQIQHALLMALENALRTGQFQVEVDALRTRCVDMKCYDKANFMANLKNNQKYFKSVDTDPLVLSPDGKSELADIIEELTQS